MQVRDQQSSWVGGRSTASDGTESHFTTSDSNDGFFERPVRLATFEWQIGVALSVDINPWSLFCNDPRIANRLAHFRNLKMDLHVQLLINGNPFYHGLGIMYYTPLHLIDDYSRLNGFVQADLVEASQRPHIYFNPTKSEGGELILPFVFPKSALDITKGEWNRMGNLSVRSMNVLQHVNESTDSLTITLMAYASNVSLNTPTSRVPPDLKPQGADEYGSISFPAHLVSKAAGSLTDVPVIGKFARATEMIATALGSVATLFGFSNPRMVPDKMALVRHFGETSTTNFQDTSLSLAVDAKKEITIDPRVCGLAPHDEMDFLSIAMRESLIAQFQWDETQPATAMLFTQDICPVSGISADSQYHVAPMGFVALPFEFWKGSVEIRLQVVCSAYHRGRLRLVWDPDYVVGPDNFNVNYSTMLDITESTEITLKIGWGQELDYLRVPDLAAQLDGNPGTDSRNTKNPFSNGVLAIYVVNPLTSPAPYSTNVAINMYARACGDFEVCGPSDLNVAPFVPASQNTTTTPLPPVGTNGPGGNPTSGSTSGYTPVPSTPTTTPPAIVTAKTVTVNPNQISFNTGPSQQLLANTVSGKSGLWIDNDGNERTGFIYMYSDVEKVFPMDLKLSRYGDNQSAVPVSIAFNQGAANIITLPTNSAISNHKLNIPLVPGWQRIDISISSQSNGIAVLREISASIPSDAVVINMSQADMVAASGGLAKPFTNSGGVSVVIPVAPAGTITFALANKYPNTPCNIMSMGQTSASQSEVPDGPNTGAEKATMHSYLNPGPTVSIAGAGNYLIRTVSYFAKTSIVPQGQVEDLQLQSEGHQAPEALSSDIMMGPSSEVRGLNDIYFGERVTSIRQMLKRYTTCYYVDMPDGENPATFTFVLVPHYPQVPTGTVTATSKYFKLSSIFDYYSSAFVCMRGGMRLKIHHNKVLAGTATVFGGVLTRLSTERDYTLDVVSGGSEASGARPRLLRFAGSAVDTLNNKPYFEYELPYYSNLRFTSGRCRRNFLRDSDIVKSVYLWEPLGANANHLVHLNYATAEDFSLSFFLSTPVLSKTASV